MNDEKLYLKTKYNLQLSELEKYPVWVLEQLQEYLHLSWDTVQSLVSNGLLYEFKISRCKFYSSKDKTYTNKIIRKSVLNIDVDYKLTSGSYVLDSIPDDKSLIARNVKRLGYMDFEGRKTDFYVCGITYPLNNINAYKRFEKLLIDIQLSSPSDYVYCICASPEVKEFRNPDVDFWDYMLNKSTLNNKGYYTAKYINFSIAEDNRPCFKYVSEE